MDELFPACWRLCLGRGWELKAEEGEEDGCFQGGARPQTKPPGAGASGLRTRAASTTSVRKQGCSELVLHLYSLGKHMYYAF